jgi:hypothetical protein
MPDEAGSGNAGCYRPLFAAPAAGIKKANWPIGVELRLSLTMCVFMVAERANKRHSPVSHMFPGTGHSFCVVAWSCPVSVDRLSS